MAELHDHVAAVEQVMAAMWTWVRLGILVFKLRSATARLHERGLAVTAGGAAARGGPAGQEQERRAP